MSNPDPFQDLVDALRRTLTSTSTLVTTVNTSAFTAASPSPSAVASPMAKPTPFTGLFILQCSLVLEMQPHLYPNDTSKVAFIISQLDDAGTKNIQVTASEEETLIKSRLCNAGDCDDERGEDPEDQRS
ncbi:hypothetical protein DPX16_0082 [Anabarilius grahami]|uniref:Uncharacterized protein n=1 Tax=Anabarilius grahami TaxID=495550 RepID=A0A3N0Z8M3_ANAGA|nr:hypothetical protein DPX16_0082 [Anabarilius grahami]